MLKFASSKARHEYMHDAYGLGGACSHSNTLDLHIPIYIKRNLYNAMNIVLRPLHVHYFVERL